MVINVIFFSFTLLARLHLLEEALGGLVARDVVRIDLDGRVLLDVAGGLGGAMLHDKTAEASQIDVLTLFEQAVLHCLHETLDDDGHVAFVNSFLLKNHLFLKYFFFLTHSMHWQILVIFSIVFIGLLYLYFILGLQRYESFASYENFI